MKKIILSFFIMISTFLMTSCVSMEDVAYHEVYVVGTTSYPVYYINSYPYYWFDNTWIMVPRYRYRYIHPIVGPRHIRAYRPNPHKYMHRPSPRYDRRPGDYKGHRPSNNHRPNTGVPHTRQPNVGGTNRHGIYNGNGGRHSNGGRR